MLFSSVVGVGLSASAPAVHLPARWGETLSTSRPDIHGCTLDRMPSSFQRSPHTQTPSRKKKCGTGIKNSSWNQKPYVNGYCQRSSRPGPTGTGRCRLENQRRRPTAETNGGDQRRRPTVFVGVAWWNNELCGHGAKGANIERYVDMGRPVLLLVVTTSPDLFLCTVPCSAPLSHNTLRAFLILGVPELFIARVARREVPRRQTRVIIDHSQLLRLRVIIDWPVTK